MEATRKAAILGKLTSNWEGAYMIAKKVHCGTFILATFKATMYKKTWSSDNLRRCYI